ncbi:hypothetical protein ACWYXN_26700 [Janthinobacterium aestuarii]
MKKTVAIITLSLLPCFAFAAEKTITSPVEIKKILAQIPVTDKDFAYKNVGERIERIGMKISSIRIDKVGKEDAEPPLYQAGDELIYISTSEPSEVVKAICPIMGSPMFTKRRGKYIASGRTAYWLLHNKCETGEKQ